MTLTLARAQEDFLRDAEARGLRESTLRKYRVMLAPLTAFSEQEGRPFLVQFDLPALRRFRESWLDGGISALKKLERLRAFYRFAHESGWIPENLPKKLKNPKVSNPPTLPFTKDEMVSILKACPDCAGDAHRLRAFVLLLRYSGMRIGDTATCARDRLAGRRLLLYMQKNHNNLFIFNQLTRSLFSCTSGVPFVSASTTLFASASATGSSAHARSRLASSCACRSRIQGASRTETCSSGTPASSKSTANVSRKR
jgi:site-specific recombinase XerD